jgi:multiple sugar transport system permease protein
MLYPFALMISGACKSETDFYYVTPYPRFWTNDTILFQKYCESKYNLNILVDAGVDSLSLVWQQETTSWRDIQPPPMTTGLEKDLDDYFAWREQFDMPENWYALGHARIGVAGGQMLPKNARLFRKNIYELCDGDLGNLQTSFGEFLNSWSLLKSPADFGSGRKNQPRIEGVTIPYAQFKRSRPKDERLIFNLDGTFWATTLHPRYPSIEKYNTAHGTEYADYKQVFLATQIPADGLQRTEWEDFVRNELAAAFIRIDVDDRINAVYTEYLAEKYRTIENLNSRYETDYPSFTAITCSPTLPQKVIEQVDWQNFISEGRTVQKEGRETTAYLFASEKLTVHGPRQEFEAFVANRRGACVEQIRPLAMPIAAVDYYDCMQQTSELRWEFTTRNFKQVFEYILLRGRGIVNTVIYCFLAIAGALLVNPLAAYALSRYKPPSQYNILLFCMATMAFPAAVTMIPSFLLLKRFPLWPLLGAGTGFFVAVWLSGMFFKRVPEYVRLFIGVAAGILTGFWLIPTILGEATVSLLNTFAALVLPGLASGYFIFLLKGFFDSLPRELYEAADIDGASEWTKFWLITMNLSKPILAIIAMGAFQQAYSQFMMALIIIPDQKMWTLMVWLYQLQQTSHQSVVYASLVIAAIPTFIVFAICQNIIIRGIVVPSEK